MKEKKTLGSNHEIDHKDHTGHEGHEMAHDKMNHKMHAEHDMHNMAHDHSSHRDYEDHEMARDHMNHEMHVRHEMDNKAHDHSSHSGHEGHGAHVNHAGHEQMFRKRFWVSLLLSIPVLLYSQSIQKWLGFSMPQFPGSRWLVPLFSLIIFIYGGIPFIKMAIPELMNKKPGMMSLISLAISVSFVYSVSTTFFPLGDSFYWELVTLIVIMLLGHWMEMRSVRRASSALDELAKLMPDSAELILEDGKTKTIPTGKLKNGDLILIRPGESVAVDGEVVEGESDINEALITGESKPVKKVTGSAVIAGSINEVGSLRVRVSATGDETALAGIMRLVREAQMSKSNTQILADKAAAWLFYAALATAVIAAVLWSFAVGLNVEVLKRVVTVLVVACPHALGLAVPLVVAISTAMGAEKGILVRDRLALEEARKLDIVMFDKTGTLTEGRFGIASIETADGKPAGEYLALAATVEGDSEHLIARSFMRAVEEKGLSMPEVSEFEAIKGRGIQARVKGTLYHVGGPRLLEMLKVELPDNLASFTKASGEKGQSVVYLVEGKKALAAFSLADMVRKESKQVVQALHDMGIQVAMITGDSQKVAGAVAEEIGIDRFFAETLPEDKDKKVAALQKEGKRVAMVGDGVNDAPALARANVGIAIGSGTDVAVESAGLILVKNNPLDIVRIIRLSRATYRKMIENLIWATGYNVIALPIAAGALAHWGILLSPAVGAIFMSLSTVIVAINAQLLRRKEKYINTQYA
jgi:Cu2+-exporting ATPase